MDTIIDRVLSVAGRHEGTGNGAESGDFTATLEVAPILGTMGASIDYVATATDGSELHSEHTVLAFESWSGQPTLFVLCAELSGIDQLVQTGESTFNNGRGTEGFELQIEISLDGGTLAYVWSRGAPGEALAEQSRATFPLA
jgi:hypothetical protein